VPQVSPHLRDLGIHHWPINPYPGVPRTALGWLGM